MSVRRLVLTALCAAVASVPRRRHLPMTTGTGMSGRSGVTSEWRERRMA